MACMYQKMSPHKYPCIRSRLSLPILFVDFEALYFVFQLAHEVGVDGYCYCPGCMSSRFH